MAWFLYDNGLRHERVKKKIMAERISTKIKKWFLKISQNSQENFCARVPFSTKVLT